MVERLIIGGHRGNGCTDHVFYSARNDGQIATENTLLSFEQAFSNGADYIETDIVMSADGVLFTLHNVKPEDHFFGATKPSGLLNQLKYTDIARYKTGHEQRGEIATLEETLDKVATLDPKSCDWVINLEIKGVQGSNQPYEDNDFLVRIAETVKTSPLKPERILFSSFALENIVRMSHLLPEAKYGLLFSEQASLRPIYTDTDNRLELSYLAFDHATITSALNYWNERAQGALGYLHPEITTITNELVTICAELGLGLNVWAYLEKLDDSRKAMSTSLLKQVYAAGVPISLITDYIKEYR